MVNENTVKGNKKNFPKKTKKSHAPKWLEGQPRFGRSSRILVFEDMQGPCM